MSLTEEERKWLQTGCMPDSHEPRLPSTPPLGYIAFGATLVLEFVCMMMWSGLGDWWGKLLLVISLGIYPAAGIGMFFCLISETYALSKKYGEPPYEIRLERRSLWEEYRKREGCLFDISKNLPAVVDPDLSFRLKLLEHDHQQAIARLSVKAKNMFRAEQERRDECAYRWSEKQKAQEKIRSLRRNAKNRVKGETTAIVSTIPESKKVLDRYSDTGKARKKLGI